jgi:hypothetical protein
LIIVAQINLHVRFFSLEDLHNLLNHLWMPDTYFVNAKETQVSILSKVIFINFKIKTLKIKNRV